MAGKKKAKRREYGSGSLYQRCSARAGCPPMVDGPINPKTGKPKPVRPEHACKGKWTASIEVGDTSRATRRRVTVTSKERTVASERLKTKLREIAAEGVTDADSRTTVKAWSEAWLDVVVHNLRPKSFATDRSAVKKWIVPTIGYKRLDQLTPADIRAVGQAQRDAGRSSSTAHRTHTTLGTMLKAAILEGHHVPRRVLDVAPPEIAPNDRTSMTSLEALAMLQVASFLPHGSRWAMAFLHGMRQAECLGLTWDSVDLDKGLVTVEWQLQPLPYKDRKNKALGFRIPDKLRVRHLTGAFHLTAPKTKKSFRVVPLVPAMREALEQWKEVAPASPHGLVWPDLDGSPTDDRYDREEWYAMQGAACVGHPDGERPYYVHEARHTTATRLLEEGVDPHTVTAIMGHSSILTTRGYQHPDQRPALAALVAVAGRLELGTGTK